MINKTKTKLALIATVAALGLAMPAAAMARSSHTTGSAAGYASPYGGADVYDYAPGYGYNQAQVPQWWNRSGDYYRSDDYYQPGEF
jgi:hypothetical protein